MVGQGCLAGFSSQLLLPLRLLFLLGTLRGVSGSGKSVSGVSGSRFSGNVIREVPPELLAFSGWTDTKAKAEAAKGPSSSSSSSTCERWIVVTSIFDPSPATRKLGEMTRQGWCYVVVADMNGPSEWTGVEGVTYLTVEMQQAMYLKVMKHIPWRHFGRKNIGFLYAIARGAKVIYDTDDDNRLKVSKIPILGFDSESKAPLNQPVNITKPIVTTGASLAFNPYPSFNSDCGHIWPRGFPLDFVNGKGLENWTLSHTMLKQPPAVQQFLADEDPDVDAIFRLTRSLPCTFKGLPEDYPELMQIPPNIFVPYNAQATVHLYEGFWGLLLPVTVHGRVSDIWRAYLTQKLLWDVGQSISFAPAHVIHDRVAHDYLKDFQSESDLYLKSTALVNFLSSWSSDAPTLVERLEQLWAALYSRGFVEEADLKLAQAWIRDLLSMGYKFPDLRVGEENESMPTKRSEL
mmetsp:Transcript_92499/g.193388  ORF Transcript_92499/g.193388 Transcript_92499/m.193388 type:complete len:461 (+) Transcript_92499:128-1510(+)|eukprot:CAMPEP_0206432612 /NCGR_PEP_ID=MMETSP0324_2-20121206/8063_1 /ASSEMBLY_ACC=CAM_ASM_000836 /TAXON_ID=2866 /ORGANISM="Crypthecodinium cohnii, Strain Seligo" /LENGTH=460 /DNA_ID=CAMNT_0053898763 /DNA_START=54 /DNA_END=1436 /DNA_ORIENTATION=+